MKKLILAIALTATPVSAHAWFFFYIPGSVIQAIKDAFKSKPQPESPPNKSNQVGDNKPDEVVTPAPTVETNTSTTNDFDKKPETEKPVAESPPSN